jgi:hypothetical protein
LHFIQVKISPKPTDKRPAGWTVKKNRKPPKQELINEKRVAVIAMAKEITIDVLRAYYYLPIAQVAKCMGICTTLMKKICRKNNIYRWPYRQVPTSILLTDSTFITAIIYLYLVFLSCATATKH